MTSVTVTVHFIKHYWYDKNRCLNTDGVRAVGCGEFDIKNTMIQQVLQQSVQCAVVIRWHLFVLKPSFLRKRDVIEPYPFICFVFCSVLL